MAMLEKKKNGKIMVIGLVFIFIIVVYVIFISFNSKTLIDPNFTTSSDKKDFLKVDFNILNNEVIDGFNSWSSIPVEVGSTGRTNPFSQ